MLGVHVSFDGSASAAVQKGIAHAWSCFAKNKTPLCARRAPLGKRISLLDSTVKAAAFHCFGSLLLTRVHLAQIRAAQYRMLRYMIRVSKDDQEGWGTT
eukprot:2498119-Pyramimonas_sp.AAC.1